VTFGLLAANREGGTMPLIELSRERKRVSLYGLMRGLASPQGAAPALHTLEELLAGSLVGTASLFAGDSLEARQHLNAGAAKRGQIVRFARRDQIAVHHHFGVQPLGPRVDDIVLDGEEAGHFPALQHAVR
jgi:hypothetical protein